MAIRRACFLGLLSVPLAALSVETTETLTRSVTTQHVQAQPNDPLSSQSRFSREQWGLSETEWRRYETLMRGIRGSVSPGTLSPIEVLGIHARDEAERREYSRRWAQMMKEDAERILAFQRAYHPRNGSWTCRSVRRAGRLARRDDAVGPSPTRRSNAARRPARRAIGCVAASPKRCD